MSVNEKMKQIADNIRYRTSKTGLLGLDAMGEEIKGINWVADPFFSNAEKVGGVSQMTDKTKLYVFNGTLWMYQSGSSTLETVTEQIVGTTDNPWGAGRLSSGNPNGLSGYVTTPYIDLTKYDSPFTLHLGGIPFNYVNDNYRFSQYKTDKTHIATQQSKQATLAEWFKNSNVVVGDNNSLTITLTPPIININSVDVAYARFSGQGTEADANVYITYEKSDVIESAWVDTGITATFGKIIPTDETISLPIQYVEDFMNSAEYKSNDYSYTQVTSYAGSGGARKDLPNPLVFEWQKIENAILYAVSVNSQTYYTTENSIPLSNFIPNTQYEYSVYALCADGSVVAIDKGVFSTEGRTRMLNIGGIQNVRDIGGYAGTSGKKVRYGLIYRGSAMDENASTGLITESGKHEMVERLGIGTDIDLRYGYTESPLGVDFINTKSGYEDYPEAITNATQRNNFKSLLESIVIQLMASKPIYIHCSGGCDRTGTLVFLLLGLLGVSESDLAKEYELSSFSEIGQGRHRSSTVYDYKGMVEAIKVYSGTTITDKFVAFATDCGVSADTITSFRNLMLG